MRPLTTRQPAGTSRHRRRRVDVWGALAILLAVAPVAAQELPPRTYQTDRADEDWSFLKTTPNTDAWDPVKYVPLGREDWFLTASGEVRFRPEGLRIRETDNRPSSHDNYLLQRYLFGADVHMGRHVRAFAEIQSGIINGRLQTPRPTDQNSIDLHQAFLEWRDTRSQRRVDVKVGRQELAIGSSRLISASPGLNVKRSFDGVQASINSPRWGVEGAVATLVGLESGVFDDTTSFRHLFWGVAAHRPSPRFRSGDLGGYYLGIDTTQSVYAQGIGPERRHTVGMKWTGTGARFSLNYDALFQWGHFTGLPIRAWAFATETAFQLSSSGWRPRVSVRTDIASGDRNARDGHLESFNPLFPGNSYSGAVGLLGPTNLTDLTPALALRPSRALTLGFESPSYWRTTTADGVYATDLRLLVPPAVVSGSYVGSNPGVLAVWQATPHWQFQGVVTRMIAGTVLKQTFVSSGFGFYSFSAVYRF